MLTLPKPICCFHPNVKCILPVFKFQLVNSFPSNFSGKNGIKHSKTCLKKKSNLTNLKSISISSRRNHRQSIRCNDSPGNISNELVELPIFPLPLVLFPGSMLPLQIFEYRYRILMQTLLQTDMRFGIIYSGKENGLAAAIGCVGEVVKYEKLVDDRYFLVCKGQERFRIIDIVRRRPYLVARVEWLEDRPSDQSQDLNTLSDSVEALLKDVIRLSNKMKGSNESTTVPDIRRSAFPTPFSFWVASMFESAPSEQQALLELTDTVSRLLREQETLKNTLNYLTAAAAVKEAFPDE